MAENEPKGEQNTPNGTRGLLEKVLTKVGEKMGERRKPEVTWKLIAIISTVITSLLVLFGRASTEDRAMLHGANVEERAMLRELIQETIKLQRETQKASDERHEESIQAIRQNTSELHQLSETMRAAQHVYNGADPPTRRGKTIQ